MIAALVAFTAYLRLRRAGLNRFGEAPDVTLRFGVRWLNTWADRIPLCAEAAEAQQATGRRKQSAAFVTDFGFLREATRDKREGGTAAADLVEVGRAVV